MSEKKQMFEVRITRQEFLALPMATRRRLMSEQSKASAAKDYSHRKDIFRRLANCGISQSAIADQCGISRQGLTNAIRKGFSNDLYNKIDQILIEMRDEIEEIRIDFNPF